MATRGVYTDVYREKLALLGADLVGGANVDAPLMRASYFKIGEGGSTAGVPDPPDPTLTDIQASGAEYSFTKSFGPGDVTATLGVLQFVMTLDPGEANGPGVSGDPVFYEIGIFDDAGTMLAYVTFDGKLKNAGLSLAAVINIKYART